jgi:hypothetical protein
LTAGTCLSYVEHRHYYDVSQFLVYYASFLLESIGGFVPAHVSSLGKALALTGKGGLRLQHAHNVHVNVPVFVKLLN